GGHTATLVHSPDTKLHAPDTKLHAPDTKRAEAGTAPAARLRDCWRLGAAVQGAGGCGKREVVASGYFAPKKLSERDHFSPGTTLRATTQWAANRGAAASPRTPTAATASPTIGGA